MKRNIFALLVAFVGFMFVLASCQKDDDITVDNIIGTWKSDNDGECKRYTNTDAKDSYKLGAGWWVGQTTEAQAETFYWKMEGSTLTEQWPTASIFIPRIYTITKLTASKLQYVDSADENFSFTKQ
ncbi:MAG: hypothetical protein LBS63_03565 [Prevotellaceae bacterium]|jgi:hypothetical protein|nr:hypothetical protein [Prevotellaceae bacterium]